MRNAKIERKTKETQIELEINLDGTGERKIDTKVGFLNHMLELLAKHSLIDLKVVANGDLDVDEHHTVEDIGIVLGQAVKEALKDKKGINRYGYFILPMDEALTLVSVDLGGRPYFVLDTEFKREKVGDLSTELIYDFFEAFSTNCGANLHIKTFYGRNEHHKIEGIFKAFAKAFRIAVEMDNRNLNKIPSTKGML